LPCKTGKPWARACCRFCRTGPTLRATFPTALQPHTAHIVLPAFARSGPADSPPLMFFFIVGTGDAEALKKCDDSFDIQ
jgi:hypothetical protein